MLEADRDTEWAHIAQRNGELKNLFKSKQDALKKAERLLNKKAIEYAVARLLELLSSEDQPNIIIATTMARTNAQVHTTNEREAVRQLQIQCDCIEMEQQEFHGKYIFDYEVLLVKAKDHLEKMVSK